MADALTITDPRFEAKATKNAFDQWAMGLIRDERDLPFAYLITGILTVLIPSAVVVYALPDAWTWWAMVPYLALLFGVFFDRYILMLHNTSHRPFFKKEHAGLRHIIPWICGPICGQSPETYYAHHIGMHHPENNLEDDLSTTMPFQRDSFVGFMQYFLRFFFAGLFDLSRYHALRKRKRLMQRAVIGEVSFYVFLALVLWLDWRATVVVFVVPFVMARFLMMAGNWAQHAFIDPEAPDNCYRNSITCINTRYNQRCYNDGYHIGHHLKANRHWTDMPRDFEDTRDKYIAEDAIVFHYVDYFMIWAMLMAKQHRRLAKYFVELRDEPRSTDEIVALFKARLVPIRRSA